jgi:hypothetical protein
MTKTSSLGTATLVATLCFSVGVAGQLPGLIDKNVKSAQSASERLVEPEAVTPQLWIHVRSAAQQAAVKGKLDWFEDLQVDGRRVRVRPIQVVTSGPQQNQLRFFKLADRATAQVLVTKLKEALPGVSRRDMSREYRQVRWIEPGHLELWLAPSATRIAIR